jgi:hypothetical protein
MMSLNLRLGGREGWLSFSTGVVSGAVKIVRLLVVYG